MDVSHSRLMLLAAASLTALSLPATSQGLPQSPRTVFKCENGGETVYTDKACPGAQRAELLRVRASPASSPDPHPGSYSGAALDAQAPAAQAPAAEMAAGAAEPLPRLAGTPQAECPHLGQRIALVEAEERTASSQTMPLIQERLVVQRKRYSELGCSPYWVSSSQTRMGNYAVRSRVWASSGGASRSGG